MDTGLHIVIFLTVAFVIAFVAILLRKKCTGDAPPKYQSLNQNRSRAHNIDLSIDFDIGTRGVDAKAGG